MPLEFFQLTTADKNEGSIDESGSRCPQRRLLRQEYRRPEGGSYIQNCDFIEVAHVLFKFTTADEMYLIPPSKGGEGVVSVTDRPVLSIRGQPPGSQGCRPPLSRGIFRELPIFSEGPLPAFRIPTAASRGLDSDTEDIAAPFLQPGGIAAPIDHGGADPSIAA